MLAWAGEEGLAIGVVGSGSNLLVADDGFRGLALKLDGELATIERDGERLLCGGGARLPSAAAKAAGWGLSGLEFGVNIPGTAGGAVRMNANAYGGQLAEVLEWVDVCTRDGPGAQAPGPARLRLPQLEPAARARSSPVPLSSCAPATPTQIKTATGGDARRSAARRSPPGSRPSARPSRTPRTSVPRAGPPGSCWRRPAAGGCRWAAPASPTKHANFVENTGAATTADVLALMAEGRRRVHERFGVVLEPEVQLLGEVRWPEGWEL